MQQNGGKCNSLSAFDQREGFKKFQDGFLKDKVVHIPCVSELQCLVGLGGKKSFSPPFDPREKTLTQTRLGTTNIASRGLCFTLPSRGLEGYCLLIYQQHRGIRDTTHPNTQTLSSFCGSAWRSRRRLGPTRDPARPPRAPETHVPALPPAPNPVATDH